MGPSVPVTPDARTTLSDPGVYTLLFDAIRDIVLLVRPDGRIADANEAASEAYRYGRDELMTMNVADLRSPEFAGSVATQMDRADAEGILFEALHRRKDGSTFPVELSSRGIDLAGERVLVSVIRDITKRKKAEENLRRSEERYRSLYSSMSEGVLLHDIVYDEQGLPVDYRLVDANPAFESITGIAKVRALGRLASDLYGAGTAPYLDIYARVAETGEPTSFETTFDPMGKTFAISVFSPAHGQFATVFQDVTERKRGEGERELFIAQIDEQRQLFQAVVDNAPVGIAVLRGKDFLHEVANPTFQAMASGRAVVGGRYVEVWPEFAEVVLPILERVMATGEPHQIANAHYSLPWSHVGPPADGYLSAIFLRLEPSRDEEPALLLITRETTEEVRARQRVEALARLAEHRATELETALQSMADAVFVCDSRGAITLANETALRLIGSETLPHMGLLTTCLDGLQVRFQDGHPIDRQELAISRALAGETVRQQEETAIHPSTGLEIDLLISSAPIRDEAGSIVGAVHVMRDITELMELDRLKGQFITVAAHELKTPVAIVKGYSQVFLRRAGEVTPEQRKVLEGIERGADRIDGIVQALLDVSLLSSNRVKLGLERVDLAEFVGQKVDRVALASTKHRVELLHADQVAVQADPVRLEQVLDTLLDNAVRYSPQGGAIELEVRIEGDRAVVSVRDEGIGIPEKKQGRMFQRFYRAHTGTPHDYGGLGVGLYVAREIIVGHGGGIEFESEEGKGSTFRFTLPLGDVNAAG